MAPVRLPGTRPRELETVAVTGGRPTASSTGKVTRVPEPTTALIPPAANPAAATATVSQPAIGASRGSLAHGARCDQDETPKRRDRVARAHPAPRPRRRPRAARG